MAQPHHTIDVRTIEDVQRLLDSTEFVTAEQLTALGGPVIAHSPIGRAESTPNASAEGLAPLPRRR